MKQVKIYYCQMWNYKPQAARVAEELKKDFEDVEVELQVGGRGDFVVECDGKIIFSKKALKDERFPEVGEISQLLKEN